MSYIPNALCLLWAKYFRLRIILSKNYTTEMHKQQDETEGFT